MKIGIAGPYSASTESRRQENLDALNRAAAAVYRKGHIPIIGVNAALAVVAHLDEAARYDAMMRISLAVIDGCDAILLIGESPGAVRELELVVAKGLPAYTHINEVPESL